MKISDRIYGEIKIENPIVKELINTKAFQQMKNVNQYGGVNLIYPENYQTTRFEHSIGVWHVLNKLGVDIETQVAGLIHDIGHCAFSHMVDQALANEQENFHEENIHLVKGMEEVNEILKRDNLKVKSVDEYPEIKKSLPDVGADRIDYAIRDFVAATNSKTDLGCRVLENIKLVGRDLVFTDIDVASEYAITGLDAMYLVIYDPKVSVVYAALANILKTGLHEKWLIYEDLFNDDLFVMKKILEHKESLPEEYIDIFNKKFEVVKGTKEDHHFHHVKLKVRYFDPFIIIDGNKIQLSTINKEYKNHLAEKLEVFEKRKEGEYYKVIFEE